MQGTEKRYQGASGRGSSDICSVTTIRQDLGPYLPTLGSRCFFQGPTEPREVKEIRKLVKFVCEYCDGGRRLGSGLKVLHLPLAREPGFEAPKRGTTAH